MMLEHYVQNLSPEEQTILTRYVYAWTKATYEDISQAHKRAGLKRTSGLEHFKKQEMKHAREYMLISRNMPDQESTENVIRFMLDASRYVPERGYSIGILDMPREYNIVKYYGMARGFELTKYMHLLAYKGWDVLQKKVRENTDNIGKSLTGLESILPKTCKAFKDMKESMK